VLFFLVPLFGGIAFGGFVDHTDKNKLHHNYTLEMGYFLRGSFFFKPSGYDPSNGFEGTGLGTSYGSLELRCHPKPVPEPSTLLLLAMGIIGILKRKRIIGLWKRKGVMFSYVKQA
jgi:hypothetical protein